MSDLWAKLLLGAVQGVTEFLPVSSSGHLAVLQHYLGFKGNRLFFDVMLHFATLVAVLVYFRREVALYLSSPRRLLYVLLASLPTGVIGLFLEKRVEFLVYRPEAIAVMFMATAVMLLFIDAADATTPLEGVSPGSILLIGVFQGIAVIPGISRSGSTVFASVFCGMKREDAAHFSFMVSVPAILGATCLELVEVKSWGLDAGTVAAMAVAFVLGLFSLHIFVRMLTAKRFKWFAFYLLALALVVFVLG